LNIKIPVATSRKLAQYLPTTHQLIRVAENEVATYLVYYKNPISTFFCDGDQPHPSILSLKGLSRNTCPEIVSQQSVRLSLAHESKSELSLGHHAIASTPATKKRHPRIAISSRSNSA
jgi:hypothetical protein